MNCNESTNRHVFTSDEIQGPEFCDCGKARNRFHPNWVEPEELNFVQRVMAKFRG